MRTSGPEFYNPRYYLMHNFFAQFGSQNLTSQASSDEAVSKQC